MSLPWSFHHALCVQLCDYAKTHGTLDVSGDSRLLDRLAEITGLHELAQLGESVRIAGAGVRVYSPSPHVHLFFPASGQRPWHAHFRYQPSSISTHLAGAAACG